MVVPAYLHKAWPMWPLARCLCPLPALFSALFRELCSVLPALWSCIGLFILYVSWYRRVKWKESFRLPQARPQRVPFERLALVLSLVGLYLLSVTAQAQLGSSFNTFGDHSLAPASSQVPVARPNPGQVESRLTAPPLPPQEPDLPANYLISDHIKRNLAGPPPPGPAVWPQVGGNASHSGVSLFPGPATSGAVVKFTYTTGGAVTSPVIDGNGTVYVGSADSYLYAVNGSSCTLVWRFKTGGVIAGVCI